MILADTDGDLRPDTYIPGTSNFAARGSARNQKGTGFYQDAQLCHVADEGDHCPY